MNYNGKWLIEENLASKRKGNKKTNAELLAKNEENWQQLINYGY